MIKYFVLFIVSWRHYVNGGVFVDRKKHRSAEIMTGMMKYAQHSEEKCLLPQFLIQAKFNSGIVDIHI